MKHKNYFQKFLLFFLFCFVSNVILGELELRGQYLHMEDLPTDKKTNLEKILQNKTVTEFLKNGKKFIDSEFPTDLLKEIAIASKYIPINIKLTNDDLAKKKFERFLRNLQQVPGYVMLDCSGTDVTHEQLKTIVVNCETTEKTHKQFWENKWLDLEDNKLRGIDLSDCPNIHFKDLGKKIELPQSIEIFVFKNLPQKADSLGTTYQLQNIRELDLSNGYHFELILSKFLPKKNQIKKLILKNHWWGNIGISDNFTELEELDLSEISENEEDDKQSLRLLEIIGKKPKQTIKKLTFGLNKMNDQLPNLLREFSNLEKLILPQMESVSIKYLAKFLKIASQLKKLQVPEAKISGTWTLRLINNLKTIAGRCEIDTLKFSKVINTDKLLKTAREHLKNYKNVSFDECEDITTTGLQNLEYVEILRLSSIQPSKPVESLSFTNLKKLQKLTLRLLKNFKKITIKSLPALEKLYLFNFGINQLSIDHLKNLELLELINLHGLTSLSLENLQNLKSFEARSCTNLKTVKLNKLEKLTIFIPANCPEITNLSLSQLPMLNKNFSHQLPVLKNLERLNFNAINLPLGLQLENLSNLFLVAIRNCDVEKLYFVNLKKLGLVILDSLTKLTDITFNELPLLEKLKIENCPNLINFNLKDMEDNIVEMLTPHLISLKKKSDFIMNSKEIKKKLQKLFPN